MEVVVETAAGMLVVENPFGEVAKDMESCCMLFSSS